MASGAVPIIRPWPGAAEIYGSEWIHSSVDDSVSELIANVDADRWRGKAAEAQTKINQIADPRRVISAWADLVSGDIVSARDHFAPQQAP
jgi:hypothetical protein